MSYILEIEQVTKRYEDHTALEGVSLKIPKGCIFGLLGPNGAGKTSLIRLITGITLPDSGQLIFKGRPMTMEDSRGIGYLPEERGLYKKMKVGEMLLFLTRLRGVKEADAKHRIREWAKRMDLEKWLMKPVEDLSKGMQQKVQFIATVIHNPELIILDEPFSGFDPINANLLTQEILKLHKNGATIIFSTHRMETVEELCDEIGMIYKSQVVLQGKQDEIKSRFSSGAFEIVCREDCSDWLANQSGVELLGSEAKESTFLYQVKLVNITTKELIKELLEVAELVSFQPVVPDMRQIFIDTVKHNRPESIEALAQELLG